MLTDSTGGMTFHLNPGKHSFTVRGSPGKTLAQVTQKICVVSIHRGIQNPTGHSLGQISISRPASAVRLTEYKRSTLKVQKNSQKASTLNSISVRQVLVDCVGSEHLILAH